MAQGDALEAFCFELHSSDEHVAGFVAAVVKNVWKRLEPDQCLLELLLLVGQLSLQICDLGLQVRDLVVEVCGGSLEFATVLLQLLARFLLFPETVCVEPDKLGLYSFQHRFAQSVFSRFII